MFKKITKVIAAILIFTLLFTFVQNILIIPASRRSEYRIEGFYQLEKDSLDAVYVGASSTYAFWIPSYAWKEFGITVYPYSSECQTIAAARYIIEDARKTQPNAKYIVNLTAIETKNPVEMFHYLCDNMPESLTKYRMIYDVSQKYQYTTEEMMECYFPIIRYHDRWTEVIANEKKTVDDVLEYMSSPKYKPFLRGVKKDASPLDYTKYYNELPQYIEDSLNELIDYCTKESIDVTFVIVPSASRDKVQLGTQNAAVDLVEERGYEVFDMRSYADEIGIDYSKDYYNNKHTNYHGAIKVTNYMSKYLIDKYDFKDKRGNEKYSKWDEGWQNYYDDYFVRYLKEEDMKYFSTPLE